MITRLEYLESILSEVYDSAKRPLNVSYIFLQLIGIIVFMY